MNGYLTGAQQGRAPYHLLVTLSLCKCPVPAEPLGTARSVDKLIPAAHGYWDLYVTFWGHLPRFLSVSIVDVRDGAIMWRNGKQLLQEVESGKVPYDGQSDPDGQRPRPNHRRVPGRPGNRRAWAGA